MRAMDTKTLLAALSAAHVGSTDGLIKIVPKGQFAPVDGRTDTGVPHWTMSADLARQIIAAFDAAQSAYTAKPVRWRKPPPWQAV